MSSRFAMWACLLVILLAESGAAQVQVGLPQFGSFSGGPFDAVNLGNLNVHFAIPIRHKAGRGMPFDYNLYYDTSIWTPVTSGSTKAWQPDPRFGWQNLDPSFGGSVTYSVSASGPNVCGPNGQTFTQYNFSNFVFHATNGTSYPLPTSGVYLDSPGAPCPTPGQQITGSPTVANGWNVNVSLGVGAASSTVTDANGNVIGDPAGGVPAFTDHNGNQITEASGVWTDTLGTNPLSVTGAAPNNTVLSYTAPSGATANYTVTYSPFTVTTAFSSTCSTITDYNKSNVYLVTQIQTPDGSTYQFAYEKTTPTSSSVTGRLAQVTVPQGGTITYTYGAINCADGTPTSLTRVLNPGGTWTYTRAQTGSDNHWQTTITDPTPAANQTVIDFQNSFFETQRVVHQGSTSGPVLSTTITCYNTTIGTNPTPSSCPTTAVSGGIFRRTIFSYLPDTTGVASELDTQYANGDMLEPSEIDSYDFGGKGAAPPASPTRKVIITYGSFVSPNCNPLGNGIVGRPCAVTIENGAGDTVVAQTTYTYDQGSLASPSGTTPQHKSVSGSRGNLTTLATKVNSTATLYRTFTYFDTGTPNTATDAGTTTSGGPNVTHYLYDISGTAPHTKDCGNSFVTGVNEPLSLSRSFSWDCDGGVMTSVADENGKTATTSYTGTGSDAFYWRPFQAQDQLTPANTTTFTYPSVTASESTMLFNGGHSVVDHRTTLDAFGRPILSQTQQAPGTGPGTGTYDSVQTTYDVMGRVSDTFLPYAAAAGVVCSGTCPGTITTYDALSRPFGVDDAGGSAISYTYNFNDVLQVAAPAPTGEHAKQKQLEYDGLGRLSSVCEVTSATGSGTCGQNNSQTGFWTKYTYDLLGDLTGVTQNAQAATGSQQNRSYTFDMAGRLLTESNPETGGITYIYDSWDSACGTYTSAGDLVEKKDAVGNVTCLKYDALHRNTDTTYPSGSYASATDQKHFVYDSATVNGVAMVNAKARLAEAYTGTSSAKKTDEGFSYSARGEVVDVYESTQNSGGYYHVNATYWANGKLDVLNGGTNALPGLPAITYGASDGSGLDGEGRVTKVYAATGQNPVNSVGYNVAQQVTGVTFGSLDSDAYQFDPNTSRMTKYTFNMGTGPTTDVGALTWNANGTLQQLQITDHINTANSQTCTFGYDDLVRITSANCGSVWSQTFGFDPFGNLSKSGSAAFTPTYTGASGTGTSPTNQYYQTGNGGNGASNYYDANGNLKFEGTQANEHSYTWDGDGNMLSVDTSAVTVIYDALDRMIEQTRGSVHTQIVYGPYGLKLALMNGQTLVNAFVKLPGGARAVYNSSGLAYYRHADHLGTSRLETTPGRAKQYDVAYAPYGEDYDGSGTQDLAFTDENQDTVKGGWSTNLYDFMLREYRTAQGRWTSPDPAGLGAADPLRPQTWNRYEYVENNPLAYIDPDGTSNGDCYSDSGAYICGPTDLWWGPGSVMGGNYMGCFGAAASCTYTDFPGSWSYGFGVGGDFGPLFEMPPGVALPAINPLLALGQAVGLPSGLSCPVVGGISSIICGGINPIMDETALNSVRCLSGAGPLQLGQSRCPQSWWYNFSHPSATECATIATDAAAWSSTAAAIWTSAKWTGKYRPWSEIWELPAKDVVGAASAATLAGAVPPIAYVYAFCRR